MANNQAIIFTDGEYLTEAGIKKKLGISIIGAIWDGVLNYRAQFRKELPLKKADDSPFYFTATPTIRKFLDDTLSRIRDTCENMRTFSDRERKAARKTFHFNILKSVSRFENAEMSDLSLKALVNNAYHESDERHRPVINYLNALNFYDDREPSLPNETFLAGIYAKMLGTSELTKFYREDSSGSKFRQLYGYQTDRVPSSRIEPLIDGFYDYVDESEGNAFLKFAATLFYFSYVEPFDELNKPVAALFAKGILAKYLDYNNIYWFPFESVFVKNAESDEAMRATKKDGDLTYYVLYVRKAVEQILQSMRKIVEGIQIDSYSSEYKNLSESEKAVLRDETRHVGKPEQLTIDLSQGFEAEEEAPSPKTAQEEKDEQPSSKPSEITISKQNADEPSIARPFSPHEGKNVLPATRLVTIEEMRSRASQTAGYGFEEDALSEKEVKEYIRYLLETNPNLNKNQASFFATHRTPGRYYSIQQFKKHANCAYETARTSMDKLAKEGYYEKLQVKNKFVYTPKNKGDK